MHFLLSLLLLLLLRSCCCCFSSCHISCTITNDGQKDCVFFRSLCRCFSDFFHVLVLKKKKQQQWRRRRGRRLGAQRPEKSLNAAKIDKAINAKSGWQPSTTAAVGEEQEEEAAAAVTTLHRNKQAPNNAHPPGRLNPAQPNSLCFFFRCVHLLSSSFLLLSCTVFLLLCCCCCCCCCNPRCHASRQPEWASARERELRESAPERVWCSQSRVRLWVCVCVKARGWKARALNFNEHLPSVCVCLCVRWL